MFRLIEAGIVAMLIDLAALVVRLAAPQAHLADSVRPSLTVLSAAPFLKSGVEISVPAF